MAAPQYAKKPKATNFLRIAALLPSGTEPLFLEFDGKDKTH